MSKPLEDKSPTNELASIMMKGQNLMQLLHKTERQKKFTKTKPKAKKTESQDEVAPKEECTAYVVKEELRVKPKRKDLKLEEMGDSCNRNIADEIDHPSASGIASKTYEEVDHLNEVTNMLRELQASTDKVYLTKTEKKCLEEITKFTTKVRAPLDERQMMFYNKDCEKFAVPINLKESDDQSEIEIKEAAKAVKESPSKIMTTELNTLVSYLVNLKNLIAKREIAWASTSENDYAQKAEIHRLKTEVEHLRVICSKRHSEIREKEQIIASKEQELMRWQKIVQKLKSRLLVLEKENGARDEDIEESGNMAQNRAKVATKMSSPGEPLRKTKLQLVEDALLAEARSRTAKKQQKRETGGEIRRNQGPAAMLANALYNARNEGNFVHF